MERLSSFIYCLNAERQQSTNNSINALGVLSTFKPEYVPGAFSFSVVFSILGLDMVANNTVRVTFSEQNPDGGSTEPLVDTGAINFSAKDLNKTEDCVSIPEEYQGVDFTMDFRNVVFRRNGVYVTTVYLNGKSLGEREIYVSGLNANA